jgi:hypothetical protein
MSAKITNLTNKVGSVVGSVWFDESTQSWRLTSKAEPHFQRTFPREQAAFYFWYSRFDPQTGKLRLLERPPRLTCGQGGIYEVAVS